MEVTWLFGTSLAALTAAMTVARARPNLSVYALAIAAASLLGAALTALATAITWDLQLPGSLGGQPMHLQLDPLGALFMAVVAVVGGAGAWYARGYWSHAERGDSSVAGRRWWAVFMASLVWVILARNGLHFLLGWELFSVAAYFLVSLDSEDAEARRAAWLYLAASHLTTAVLFGLFAALANLTGSWELGPVRDPRASGLFWLGLLAFGVKGATWPGHVWLPSAHANAPSHVSALLSGAAIKIGMYGLYRLTEWLPLPNSAGWVIAGLGVTSGVLGVAFALAQHDLKRLLAYHSVENIGIILIGLGFGIVARQHGHPAWGTLLVVGSLLHVWNHALFKALLFLGAGAIHHATGTRVMSQLGGLWRGMPATSALFALAAMAIAGLPPLNGFVSELLIYIGLFDEFAAGQSAYAAAGGAVLLGLTGALALACFAKVVGVVLLGSPRSPAAEHAHEAGRDLLQAMGVLASLCAIIGLLPGAVWPLVATAAGQWYGLAPQPTPQLLTHLGTLHVALAAAGVTAGVVLWKRLSRMGFRRAPTWDCGYAAPTPRMQYTAGSFARIMTEWFRWILRPECHAAPLSAPFAAPAHADEHTPETVLKLAIEPTAGALLWLADLARRLQHGRVQAYVLYVLIGVAFIAALAIYGGGP